MASISIGSSSLSIVILDHRLRTQNPLDALSTPLAFGAIDALVGDCSERLVEGAADHNVFHDAACLRAIKPRDSKYRNQRSHYGDLNQSGYDYASVAALDRSPYFVPRHCPIPIHLSPPLFRRSKSQDDENLL